MADTKKIVAKNTEPRLKAAYNKTYAAELQKELGLVNPMQVPKLEKIVLNIGLGRAKDDKEAHGSCYKHPEKNNRSTSS